VTPDGIIDIETSRQLLADIAKTENCPVDHELLVDFRETHGNLSTCDIYQLAEELFQYGNIFHNNVLISLRHARTIVVFQ